MGQFYLLSEVLTPVMAWGFLGTDYTMQQHCLQLKVISQCAAPVLCVDSLCPSWQATISQFLQGVFSLDGVRYSTVGCLAEDILTLAQLTANNMTPVTLSS